MQNVKKWFKETLNITRFTQAQFEFNSDPTSRDEEHNDLNILVFASPFERGSTTLATAYPFAQLSSDNYEKRPQAGILTINFALLPEKSADINDQSRDLFEILVHETIHILGFSNDLYKNWIDSMGKGICNQKNNLGDYTTSIIPNKSKICTKQDQFKDPVNIFKQKYGSESFCAEIQGNSIETTACYEMICSEKNELSILIDGQTLRCDAAGQKIQIPSVINYSVICPNPNIVCGVKRFLKGINNNIQISDQASVRTNVNIVSTTSALVSSQDKEKSQNNLKIIIGCTVGTPVFIVIATIASIIGYKKRWCRKHASVHIRLHFV